MATNETASAMRDMWRDIIRDLRYGWLVRSLITTLGFATYTRFRDQGHVADLRRVLENGKQPRLIAHPKLAGPLRRNMGWIGRWIGYRVVGEPFHAEDHITAMDFAILDDWKKPHSIRQPVPPIAP